MLIILLIGKFPNFMATFTETKLNFPKFLCENFDFSLMHASDITIHSI